MSKEFLNRNGVYRDENVKKNGGSPFSGMYDDYFPGNPGMGVSGREGFIRAGKTGTQAERHRRNHG